MTLRLSASLLLLAACSVPKATAPEDHAPHGLQASAGASAGEPKSFQEWVETLPPVSEYVNQPFRAALTGEMTMSIPGMVDMSEPAEANMRMDLSGTMAVKDSSHLRYEIDVMLDLSGIPEAGIPGPVHVGLLFVADGETLSIVPQFYDDWILAQLQSTGIGIENMVLTLDVALFERMVTIYMRSFEASGMDMSLLVPKGMTMEEFYENSMNPALWARSFLATTEILDFNIDETKVHAVATLKQDLFTSMMGAGPGVPDQTAMLESMRYSVTFDRWTGLPLGMEFGFAMEQEVNMNMSMSTTEFVVGPRAVDDVEFRYTMLDRQTLFPLDPWVQLMLTQMEAMIQEDDGDTSF